MVMLMVMALEMEMAICIKKNGSKVKNYQFEIKYNQTLTSTSKRVYQISSVLKPSVEITYVEKSCTIVPPYKTVPVVGTYKQYHTNLIFCMLKFSVETYCRINMYLYPVR